MIENIDTAKKTVNLEQVIEELTQEDQQQQLEIEIHECDHISVHDMTSKPSINTEDKEISVEDSPYTLQMRFSDFSDEKEFNRFVKSCERLVRNSPEYRLWINYLKESLGYYSCSITGEVSGQVTVEIHHHPVSLFTIVKSVVSKQMAGGNSFTSLEIAQRVLELHFDLKVGFIPIVKTLHEKFHNGYLNIPMELIYGNYRQYLDEYLPFIDDEEKRVIESRLRVTLENCGWNGGQYQWRKDTYGGGSSFPSDNEEDE